MTPARQPHPQQKGMEHCKDASVVIRGDGIAWIKCDKIVGDCFWIIEHGKCPKSTSPPAPSRLCDDCNIIALEERLVHLEQDLKDARKAEREQVLVKLEEYRKTIEIKAPEKGDYIYPGRKEKREIYNDLGLLIDAIRQEREP